MNSMLYKTMIELTKMEFLLHPMGHMALPDQLSDDHQTCIFLASQL